MGIIVAPTKPQLPTMVNAVWGDSNDMDWSRYIITTSSTSTAEKQALAPPPASQNTAAKEAAFLAGLFNDCQPVEGGVIAATQSMGENALAEIAESGRGPHTSGAGGNAPWHTTFQSKLRTPSLKFASDN